LQTLHLTPLTQTFSNSDSKPCGKGGQTSHHFLAKFVDRTSSTVPPCIARIDCYLNQVNSNILIFVVGPKLLLATN